MEREHFFNADGELLIVAQQGRLRFRTEFGVIEIEPGEICVIPRGVIFRVELIDGPGARLCLRELRRRLHAAGSRTDRRELPRQSARLSHARSRPTRTSRSRRTLYREMGRRALRARRSAHSPLDVVAWHGNYYPYKYDLRRFSPVGAICCSTIPIRRSSR